MRQQQRRIYKQSNPLDFTTFIIYGILQYRSAQVVYNL